MKTIEQLEEQKLEIEKQIEKLKVETLSPKTSTIFIYVMGLLFSMAGIIGFFLSYLPSDIVGYGEDQLGYRIMNIIIMNGGGILLMLVISNDKPKPKT